MQSAPVLPFILVGPVTLIVMVVIAGHLSAMRSRRDRMPASRYRIRSTNSAIMLTAVPLIGTAFSLISPDDQRLFSLVWLCCIGLLGIVFLLAMVDVCNNIRLAKIEIDRLRIEHRAMMATMRKDTVRREDEPDEH